MICRFEDRSTDSKVRGDRDPQRENYSSIASSVRQSGRNILRSSLKKVDPIPARTRRMTDLQHTSKRRFILVSDRAWLTLNEDLIHRSAKFGLPDDNLWDCESAIFSFLLCETILLSHLSAQSVRSAIHWLQPIQYNPHTLFEEGTDRVRFFATTMLIGARWKIRDAKPGQIPLNDSAVLCPCRRQSLDRQAICHQQVLLNIKAVGTKSLTPSSTYQRYLHDIQVSAVQQRLPEAGTLEIVRPTGPRCIANLRRTCSRNKMISFRISRPKQSQRLSRERRAHYRVSRLAWTI